ncbi:contact-dependent growth inhibition system immunity protein [Bacillus subtilis]|nr:contact-dependent growth inhibition system immunity protein [Pseudomonas sp. A29(2023)]MDL5601634.1 contact-dependent growth inhibition system immunity protein [Bacillus subtilis]
MNKDLPELHDFFGAYFHQDWMMEHDSADLVLTSFLDEAGEAELILIRNELQTLINWGKNEAALRSYLLSELSCYYCYWNDWRSGEIWLLHIMSKLNEKIKPSGNAI